MHWGDKYFPQPERPPDRARPQGECGGQVNDRRICERCGKELEVREARAEHSRAASARASAELLDA